MTLCFGTYQLFGAATSLVIGQREHKPDISKGSMVHLMETHKLDKASPRTVHHKWGHVYNS